MMSHRLPAVLLVLICFSLPGCGWSHSSISGRWYNQDVSIRFRENGTVLYNSRPTGLVEGRFEYNPRFASLAGAEPVKNLTIWLPGQPAMEFEIRRLGGDRLQLKRMSQPQSSPRELSRSAGIILKRAMEDHSNSLDQTPPLISASSD